MTGWPGAVLLAFLATFCMAHPAAAEDPDAFVTRILAGARAAGCAQPSDKLSQILCAGVIRVGVRNDYKSFGLQTAGGYSGFEIDLAQRIAERLGVRLMLVAVTPANRIPQLASGNVDAVIATMGHTVSRDRQIDFVRPQYYAAPTAVVGPRTLAVAGWSDIAGRTVCVPMGNFSNVVLGEHNARLMIFDGPEHLLDALRLNICSLVAHDRSLLAANVTGPEADPDLAQRFEEKFTFNSVPWGIGIARSDSNRLDRVLGLIVAGMHGSGALVASAHANHVDDEFLRQQQRLWSGPDCLQADGTFLRTCLQDPVDVDEKPTAIAPAVTRFEAWLTRQTGWSVSFPMFKGEESLELFEAGIVNSIVLVAGAIAATLGIALLFQYGLRSRSTVVRSLTQAVVTVLQCSPVIMLLVLGYLVVTELLQFSTSVALLTAIVVIGLSNGSYAAAAIAEAAAALEPGTRLATVLRLASTQITLFVVNAARASAVASFIGAPELLTALTDITSFTSERVTTYVILLVFYMAIVMAVVGLSDAVRRRFATGRVVSA